MKGLPTGLPFPISVSNSWFCNTLLKGVWVWWWCSYHIPAPSCVVYPRDGPHFMHIFEKEYDCYPKTLITVGLLKIKEKPSAYVDGCLKLKALCGWWQYVWIHSANISKAPHSPDPAWMCIFERAGGCEQLGEWNVQVLSPWLHSGNKSSWKKIRECLKINRTWASNQ